MLAQSMFCCSADTAQESQLTKPRHFRRTAGRMWSYNLVYASCLSTCLLTPSASACPSSSLPVLLPPSTSSPSPSAPPPVQNAYSIMHAPLHRSINKKGALALSFSAFLVPVMFVLFVEAFLLPTSVRNSQLAYHEDMTSALHQAVYNAPGSRIVARDTTPKLGYMLGRRDLVARQDSENPEDRPNADDETTSTRPRSTSRTTSRATRTNDDEDERSTSTRRPTATARKNDAPKQTSDNKPKIVYACAWSRMIKGTNTTPLWLTLGLSAGSVAGILIAAFTAYQYGKAHKGAAGGGGGGGMGGPPMY